MPNDLFMWFILLWSILVFVFVAIGGYFMFRKFLKKTPKEDGKSILDWQDYYINETLHL
jgi:choline-glycine betaine transporter